LRAEHIQTISGDLDKPSSLNALPASKALVYYFAPPPGESETDSRMTNFLAALQTQRPVKFIYLSTSGVYGDCKGGWVTENTPAKPHTLRAKARLAAETGLTLWSSQYNVPSVILRVGGIYGASRLPMERIRQALPVVNTEECPFTNRIHEDDLATVCFAAAEHGKAGEIYNVSDGSSSTMTDYYNALADHFSLPRPPQISLAEAQSVLSPGILSYLNESRRLDNRKMLDKLNVTLRYPNLQSGLAALK
jgi:nucleoside-diphosphate-sugar epimerase